MSDIPSPTGPSAPPEPRRRASGWRIAGRVLIGLGAAATLIGLFYAEENWRGHRDWEECQRELTSRRVVLDFDRLVPPPVPDSQNFAMTPFLAPLFDLNPQPLQPGQSPWRDTNGYQRAAFFGGAFTPTGQWANQYPTLEREPADLSNIVLKLMRETNESATAPAFATRAEAATALLAALQKDEPVIDELRAASGRPYARFNINYGQDDPASILLPHLRTLRRISGWLNARASAELALGRSSDADADAMFIFYLADSIKDEPVMISLVVRLHILKAAEDVLWEGLKEGRWSEAQLEGFQDRLSKLTLLNDLSMVMAGERAAFCHKLFDFIITDPTVLKSFLEPTNYTGGVALLVDGPRGWIYQEEISCQRALDDEGKWFDPGSGEIHPGALERSFQSIPESEGEFSKTWHHRVLQRLVFLNSTLVFQKAGLGQACVEEARTACALERCRLASAGYPETLAALAPRFLDRPPQDVINGGPLRYKREGAGHFLLYSVGWNETDDGGTTEDDPKQGDWVWAQ